MAVTALPVSAFGEEVSEALAYEAVSTEAEALPAEELAEFEGKKEASYTSGDFGYNILDDGTVEIADYTGSATELTIPSEIDGYKVTRIGSWVFSECDSLNRVIIPDSVKRICSYAFGKCINLESVEIPDSVTYMEYGVFSSCSSLKSVIIPDSITTISSWMFSGCSDLTDVTIPSTVTYLGLGVFTKCESLATVKLPDGIESIGNNLFEDCSSLTNIQIPNSVTTIGNSAFKGCKKISSVVITNGVTSIGIEAFLECESLISITIPNSVTSIGYSAFSDCSSLTSITIPGSVTSISDHTFSGCGNLKEVKICNGVTSIGVGAFGWCDSLTSITIPGSVESIGDAAFSYLHNLKTVTICNGVSSIGSHAFEFCDNLTNLTIPDSVVEIGDGAFWGCHGLTNITMQGGVTTIGKKVFSDCVLLESVIIPDSVTLIDDGAFSWCIELKDVYYKGSSSQWADITIGENNECLTDATIHCDYGAPPTIFATYPGNSKVTLKWNAVDGATKYRVFYYLNGKYTTVKDVTTTSHTVTGLTNGTKYGFLVRAFVDGAWTAYTTADNVYATPINKPVVTAYAGNGKVRINWGKISGATKYAIYTYSGGKYTHYKNTTLNYYNVTGLTNGTKYGFLVKAYVNGAWTSYNAYDLAYATPVEKPVVTAYAGSGKVRINWGKISGATKYAIYTYADGKYSLYKATTANAYNVTGLTNGTKYGFLVKAYVNGAWTTYNSYDVAFATPIDKPVITKTVAADGRVRLYWDKVEGATKYAIFTYSDGKYTIYKYTTANAYTVSGLTNGTSYGFLVRAYVNGAWTTYNAYDRVSATPKA